MKLNLVRPQHTTDLLVMPRLVEQTEYLEGVLWSDPALRLDPEVDPSDIDMYGTGTPAFWRGLIESSGYVGLCRGSSDRKYPRVELKASYGVLCKFLDFLQEELQPSLSQILAGTHAYQQQWDTDGKLMHMAGGGLVRVTGVKAQDVCRVLYPPDSLIGLESIRCRVDEILTWVPRI